MWFCSPGMCMSLLNTLSVLLLTYPICTLTAGSLQLNNNSKKRSNNKYDYQEVVLLLAKILPAYNRHLRVRTKRELLELVSEMNDSTMSKTETFARPLLSFLRSQVSFIRNASHSYDKVYLLCKISKVVFWMEYLLKGDEKIK